MQYRIFGRSGLHVSELVFGGGWVGGLLITADEATKRRAVELAQDRGIDWIDTAPSYGDGRSEEALGRLLEAGAAVPPHLSTKVRIDPTAGDVVGQVQRSIEGSLRRLQRDAVDLLQLHNRITTAGGAGRLTPREARVAIDGLDRVREQGLTRFIGITALGDTAALKEVIAGGRLHSAQVYYNLLNPSAGRRGPATFGGGDFSGLIEACVAHGVAVMAIRTLAAGVLATDVRHGREVIITETSVSADEARARRVFEFLGDGYGSRATTALRFALANPDISCVVIGVETLAHLEEAIAAAEAGPLPAEALDRLEPLYASDFGRRG